MAVKVSGVEVVSDSRQLTNIAGIDATSKATLESGLTNVDAATLGGIAASGFATAAQGTTADSALQPDDIGVSVQGYNANTVVDASYVHTDNNYTTAEKSKLSGIEAGATGDQTAAEILTAIKTVDGSTSGLDADLLDGQHGSYYYPASNPSGYQTASQVSTAISAVVDAAPATLNTLNELAAALGDDPNFATTVSTQIGTKVSKSGDTMTGNLSFGDNNKAIFGAGSDLQIYHDGSNSYIFEQGTGELIIQTNGTTIDLRATGAEYMARFYQNAQVELYYDNATKLATTSTGVDVTGSITLSGTVDGRDVAADGTKLDGIEAGATADQTAAEILTSIKTVDGSGSGLDADTLDGQHASAFLTTSGKAADSNLLDGLDSSQFLRADANDTTTGTLSAATFNATSTTNGGFQGIDADSATKPSFTWTADLDTGMYRSGTNQIGFTTGGTVACTISGSNFNVVGALNAPTVDTNSVVIGAGVTLSEATDRADLLLIKSSTAGYAGLQIQNTSNEGLWSFMTDGTTGGIYDDMSNAWHIQFIDGGETRLYHAGSEKLNTLSSGIYVTGNITASGNVTAYSDERLKSDIQTIENAVDTVKALRGVTFVKDGKPSLGVIAQEVQAVLPELVMESGNYLSVAYANMVGVLIEAIKEQQAQIDELKAKVGV